MAEFYRELAGRGPRVKSAYMEQSTPEERALTPLIDLFLGGSTQQAYENQLSEDYTNPQVEAIEPAFMGMDTVTTAVMPKLARAYVQGAARLGGTAENFDKVYGMVPGAVPLRQEMTSYHGSPHKFDQFKLDRIGTGEGAQAYGHGLYFAESPGVAKSYQLSTIDPTTLNVVRPGTKGGWDVVSRDGILQGNYKTAQEAQKNAATKSGHLYEVDIPDEHVANFLDWDAPLSEQPESVRKALKPIREQIRKSFPEYADNDDILGEGLYRMLSEHRGMDQQAASEYLNSLGIKGIKYYDGMSRGAGEGTRNLVVFDDSIVKVLKRDGEGIGQSDIERWAGGVSSDDISRWAGE